MRGDAPYGDWPTLGSVRQMRIFVYVIFGAFGPFIAAALDGEAVTDSALAQFQRLCKKRDLAAQLFYIFTSAIGRLIVQNLTVLR